MTHHTLKCHPAPFALSRAGAKPYEVRVFDRPYAVGDTIDLCEWDPDTGDYTGDSMRLRVTCITAPGTWGLPPGTGILGVEPLVDIEPAPVGRSDGCWIQLRDGRAFELLHPDPSRITLEGIALTLGSLPRFVGQTAAHYSVAQHSVLVAQHAPPAFRAAALLHDAAEAFVGDATAPLKRAMRELCGGRPSPFDEIEDRNATAVRIRFGLPLDVSPEEVAAVREADMRALATEYRDIVGVGERPWGLAFEPFDEPLRPLSATAASDRFLRVAAELGLK